MGHVRQMRIGEVVARTGLTERMIRHYETLGLVMPDRSASGQRLYDADALLALGTVQLLKQAGLPLSTIRQWLTNPLDARGLIAAQKDLLRAEAKRIEDALALLEGIDSELEEGSAPLPDQLARIIASAHAKRDEARARAFFERHFTADDAEAWRRMMSELAAIVDPQDYDMAWRRLIDDIRDALHLAPDSEAAQALLDRWQQLLEPFQRVASQRQKSLARTMFSGVAEWGGHFQHPATPDVIGFIEAAMAARTGLADAPSPGEPDTIQSEEIDP